MLLYEDDRTKDIVKRLVGLGETVRGVIIIGYITILAALLSLVAGVLYAEFWWLGALFGIILGYGLGSYIATLIIVGMEWMAQMLVAQGEIINKVKE
jgi:hypothetical protein